MYDFFVGMAMMVFIEVIGFCLYMAYKCYKSQKAIK